ncbi:MAG: VTT domain-containing protein [Spirochaetaceae bacterium]|nr:VTT domain-containing protein [Spirochaetaceae bacterium]
MSTIALGPSWLDPDHLIRTFGLIGIMVIVFAESGLLVGVFLPGDSLLFTAGLLSATTDLLPPLWVIIPAIVVAAIVGDQVGYVIGSRAGPKIFHRPDSRFFRKEFVDKAYSYFERYGGRTIVVARFVPIVRTFVPVIAGVSQMSYRTFVAYNVLGGTLWGVSVTTIGYFLGQVDFVAAHIEPILIGIVALSVLPIAFELLRARSRSRSTD